MFSRYIGGATPAPQPALTRWDHLWRFGAAIGIGMTFFALTAYDLETSAGGAEHLSTQAEDLLGIDILVGLVATPLVLLRRRWPVAIATILALLTVFSSAVGGAAILAAVSVATRRRWSEVLFVAIPTVIGAWGYDARLRALPPAEPAAAPLFNLAAVLAFAAMTYAVVVAVGVSISTRRDLLVSLRERAEAAEREQRVRAAAAEREKYARMRQAREAERTRIAREMHDVLAHRISMIAMHAGALAYRDDLDSQTVRSSAGVIEQAARSALQELREVLGVLRENSESRPADPEPPQPSLAEAAALVAETSESGSPATLTSSVDLAQIPMTISRAGYRILQEALTNARKHAPGAAIEVRLAGGPDRGLTITVANQPPARGATARPVPGAGVGLVGIQERTELLQGSLQHGPTGDGGFELTADLPWPPTTSEGR